MESVLEIATDAAAATPREAGRAAARAAPPGAPRPPPQRGLAIGSAGTHPFAMWEDQRIVARAALPRPVSALRFVARQELIFGLHVHVGIDDPEKAIHVANGMRVHVPMLLALSANSPFWRADATGLASTRMPIFRAFPRVGHPAALRRLGRLRARGSASWSTPGVIEDYTYLWYDVRPHPNFGTVEIRVMDAQTRVEHTLGLAALIQAMVKELAEHFEAGSELGALPARDARREQVAGRPARARRRAGRPAARASGSPTRELARRLLDRLREHAQDLGSGGRARGDRGPARRAATAPRARSSSTRPTTTCARSWPRSWRPPPP